MIVKSMLRFHPATPGKPAPGMQPEGSPQQSHTNSLNDGGCTPSRVSISAQQDCLHAPGSTQPKDATPPSTNHHRDAFNLRARMEGKNILKCETPQKLPSTKHTFFHLHDLSHVTRTQAAKNENKETPPPTPKRVLRTPNDFPHPFLGAVGL